MLLLPITSFADSTDYLPNEHNEGILTLNEFQEIVEELEKPELIEDILSEMEDSNKIIPADVVINVEKVDGGILEVIQVTQELNTENTETQLVTNAVGTFYDDENLITLYSGTGSYQEETITGSSTIRGYFRVNYTKKTVSGLTGYKITSAVSRGTVLDKSFRITKFGGSIAQNGAGFNESGVKGFKNISASLARNYPTSGTSYTTYLNSSFYTTTGGAGGVLHIYYQRNTGGTVYSFKIQLNPVAML